MPARSDSDLLGEKQQLMQQIDSVQRQLAIAGDEATKTKLQGRLESLQGQLGKISAQQRGETSRSTSRSRTSARDDKPDEEDDGA
jgi:septation ring formation regulator EzrA